MFGRLRGEVGHGRSGKLARARILLSPEEGETVWLGGLGIRFMIDGAQTGETFALVELLSNRASSPRRCTHQHEDEYTYVLEGEVRVAYPGDLVFKPRRLPHAFWNACDVPAWALEIISPAGFERYFEDIASLLPPVHQGPPDERALSAVMARYGFEMDMSSIPRLVERHGLVSD